MINKQALLLEVWCTLISLNFYLFQNNFARLRSSKWVLFRLKNFSWRPYTGSLHHVNIHLSYSALKTNQESTPAFTKNHHGCLATSNGLPANDFLYLLSEIVRNVILTKFVYCADSDLLYILKLRLYITTWHRMPTSHNANRAVRNIALLHNTPLRGALRLDHVLTNYVSVWFGNTSCKYNPLKKVSSEFVLLCKKAAPLHFIQATPRLLLSALIGNFANKVACFSHIASHLIAKSHVKPWSVREHDAA